MVQISSIIHTCRDSTNNMVYGCVWKWGEHHDQPADGMGSQFSDKARNGGCLIDDCILLHEHDYPMIVWLLYTILPWLSHDYPYYCQLLVCCLIIPWLSHDYPMIIPWLSHDYPMFIPWLSHDYPMFIPWLSHVYPMISGSWSSLLVHWVPLVSVKSPTALTAFTDVTPDA